LAGVHNEAASLGSGLVGLAFAFALGAVGSGLSLSRSAGYAKMVSMASEEMDIDDGRSVDRLLGEIGTGVQCAVALVVVGLKVRSSCCCRSYRSRCLLSIRETIDQIFCDVLRMASDTSLVGGATMDALVPELVELLSFPIGTVRVWQKLWCLSVDPEVLMLMYR